MNKKGKIKAFTISEMMVVLVITLIVVGLAFTILNLVQQQMRGIAYNYEHRTSENLLRQALWVDFGTYSHISYDDRTGTLTCSNALGGTTYLLENGRIVREKDTFALVLDRKSFYFDGQEQQSGQVDAVRLEVGEKEALKTIFVYKENAASKYLN